MFALTKAKPAPKPAIMEEVSESTSPQSRISTLIAKTAVFTGNIRVEESIYVKGGLIGNIDAFGEGILVGISESARVEGNITAEKVVVMGVVSGRITAKLVKLGPNAVVNGEIVYDQISVQDGAQINNHGLVCTRSHVIDNATGESMPPAAGDQAAGESPVVKLVTNA